MSHIYILNQSDDPEAEVAIYKKKSDIPDMNVHAWITAYLGRGSRARVRIDREYYLFVAYTSNGNNVLYETALVPIIEGEGYYRVYKTGNDIQIMPIAGAPAGGGVTVEVDRKVAKLVYINVVRGNEVFFSFPTSPGNIQQFTLDNELFLTKVKPEVEQGNVLLAREILMPPSTISIGSTAILTGTRDTGYSFYIERGQKANFIRFQT